MILPALRLNCIFIRGCNWKKTFFPLQLLPFKRMFKMKIYGKLTNIEGLPPVSQWVEPIIEVLDDNRKVRFHIMDALNFHGPDAVGGVVLGFRLLQKAFSIFSPHQLMPRREITLFTSFPGLGAKDTFELIARLVSENRYIPDQKFEDSRARAGVEGRFYFSFRYREKIAELSTPHNIPDNEFIRLGRACKIQYDEKEEKAQIMRQWINAKYKLASLLLTTSCDQAVRVL